MSNQLEEQIRKLKAEHKLARESITLFKSPLKTISLCIAEFFALLKRVARYLGRHMATTLAIAMALAAAVGIHFVEGTHQQHTQAIADQLYIAGYWIVLGILSSVGLGTGLHTFVLYLGPFIAKVTLAATECNSLDFDVTGPNAFLCPTTIDPTSTVDFISIVRKVQFACLCWGFGTAIGELPPYFVARAARQAGQKLEEMDEFEEESKFSSFMQFFKKYFDAVMSRFTFLAILALASIPNPLFDLAGLTCGYSLVPFMTFFGATVLGKAVIKAHLQCASVVIVFSKEHLETIVGFIDQLLPFLQGKLTVFLDRERARFHPENIGKAAADDAGKSMLAMAWDVILLSMLAMFFVSIVNSTAQSRLAEQQQQEIDALLAKKNKSAPTAAAAAKQQNNKKSK